ncbi:hypothetical protein ALC53_10153 [Atta colombica]|uniref:Uncharacterized protein n=1 Tax=Atta colombica TaxID=520822 RepID=A0A195B4D0_9HYME|nr:hypothetical protein ALC53_10153 [Atta colombica]
MRYHRILDITLPCQFDDLPERKTRKQLVYTKLSRNRRDVNPKNFTICVTLHDTHATSIRGQEKTRYLSNLLSRNVYNLKGFSPAFKNLQISKIVNNDARITDFEPASNYIALT